MTSASQFTIPPEWAAHRAIWTAWPSHPDLWQDNLAGAREEIAGMVRALVPGDRVRLLACGEEALESARAALGDVAEVLPAAFGDIWLRDTGPIFTVARGRCQALRFATNGWGGKYLLPDDDRVGDVIAEAAGADIRRHDFVLEGGALEHNGSGWILTTRQCLLNPNRNPGWTEPDAERYLASALNCSRLLWLEEGLLNDHTDGHIDNLARFVSAESVVCQVASGPGDPNADLCRQIETQLQAMGLSVQTVPSPGLVCGDDGEILPASHMNFVIGNATVVVPVYNDAGGMDAVDALRQMFPGRDVVGIPSRHLITGGGSFHCITQQEPLPGGATA